MIYVGCKSLAPAALRLNTLCLRHPCLSHREQGQRSHQHALSLCRPGPRRVELGHVTRLASQAQTASAALLAHSVCVVLRSREQTWTQNTVLRGCGACHRAGFGKPVEELLLSALAFLQRGISGGEPRGGGEEGRPRSEGARAHLASPRRIGAELKRTQHSTYSVRPRWVTTHLATQLLSCPGPAAGGFIPVSVSLYF